MTHNLTETEPQTACTVPWCDLDALDGRTHLSPIQHVTSLAPGTPRIVVMLAATGSLPPHLFVGHEFSVPIAQAPALASLLSRLGHYELAAAITATAALAGDDA